MKFLCAFLCFGITLAGLAQGNEAITIDSTNFKKIYPYALRGDMKTVFQLLENANDEALTEKQKAKKQSYYERFSYKSEAFDYNTEDTSIINLFERFQQYWRSVLIEGVSQRQADSLFRIEMRQFIKDHYNPKLTNKTINRDYYKLYQEFFRSKNMYGLGMGKTGHLYDLYLWKEQEEVDYKIDLPEGQTIEVPVVFMRDFVSNGWSHYTTFGHSYSGGWAMPDKLFCVEESYRSKEEEDFMISYVSHEGQHFSDYKIYPKLKQPDLEYRAKLTELALAKETTYKIINKFITNSKKDTSNAHAYANYMVIKSLSERCFKTEFESDLEKWKQIPVKKINRMALKLLKGHSKTLDALGAETVEAYITNSVLAN